MTNEDNVAEELLSKFCEDDLMSELKDGIVKALKAERMKAEEVRQLLIEDPALDRDNKEKGTLRELVVVALNGLFHRGVEIKTLTARNEALQKDLEGQKYAVSCYADKIKKLEHANTLGHEGFFEMRDNFKRANENIDAQQAQIKALQQELEEKKAEVLRLNDLYEGSLLQDYHRMESAYESEKQRSARMRAALEKIAKGWDPIPMAEQALSDGGMV